MTLDDKLDALGIGQRVPGPMGSVGGVARVSPTRLEAACQAYWERHARIPWSEAKEEWKPYYREAMTAAITAYLNESPA
jgi:hypothetical protein